MLPEVGTKEWMGRLLVGRVENALADQSMTPIGIPIPVEITSWDHSPTVRWENDDTDGEWFAVGYDSERLVRVANADHSRLHNVPSADIRVSIPGHERSFQEFVDIVRGGEDVGERLFGNQGPVVPSGLMFLYNACAQELPPGGTMRDLEAIWRQKDKELDDKFPK